MLPPAILASLLLTSVPAASASNPLLYNATADAARIECVYPISGQYALLQRVLYYGLLLFSIVSRGTPWLVAGALGAAMTYSASAAVHAALLLGMSHPLLDLDCLGIYAIVSVGWLVWMIFFFGTGLLRESPARMVFYYWGFLMLFGSFFAFVAISRGYHPSEERCDFIPGDGTNATEPILLTSTAQLGLMPFNCTYSCFNTRQAFREPSDIRVVPAGMVSKQRSRLMTASNGLWAFFGDPLIFFGYVLLDKTIKERLKQKLLSAINTLGRSRWMAKQKLPRGQKRSRRGWMSDLLSIACVGVIVLNEVFIHIGTQIPVSEPMYAVGQWGPWVAVLMALAGSAIVEFHRPGWEKKQRMLEEESVLAQEENAPSMRLGNLAGGQASAAGAERGAEMVQWPEAAFQRGTA